MIEYDFNIEGEALFLQIAI